MYKLVNYPYTCIHHFQVSCILDSLENLKSDENLNTFFKEMISTELGDSNVDSENEVLHAKVAEMAITKIFGEECANYIMVTGSAAQNLRCVSHNDRGDVDLVILSNFPPLTQEEQTRLLVPCTEPGFFQVKSRDRIYPYVERGGIKYLNANSLRGFDKTWLTKQLFLAIRFLGSWETEYEKAGSTQLASEMKWRSSYYEQEDLSIEVKHRQSFYYYIMARSYRENISKLLDPAARMHSEVVLSNILAIIDFMSSYCIGESQSAIEALEKLDSEFKHGVLHVFLDYIYQERKIGFSGINRYNAEILRNAHGYFEEYLQYKDISDEEVTKLNKERRKEVHGSLDLVPAIACEGFPTIAISWCKRTAGKKWPTDEIVAKIMRAGFQLVPKTSKDTANDPMTSFRLSFNTAEEMLAKSLSKFHRECYRVLKMLYYELLKKNPKVLTTYHLKTVLFWVVEETNPLTWKTENRAYCCYLLLKFLTECLSNENLPHYFLPGCNILKHLDKEELQNDISILDKWMECPERGSRIMIDEVKSYYNNAQLRSINRSTFSERIETFFKVTDAAFKRAKEKYIESTVVNMSENKKMDFLSKMEDQVIIGCLKFCFDIISVRKEQATTDHLFRRYAPLPSPLATFFLTILPVSKQIIDDIILPHFPDGSPVKKKVKDIEWYLWIASYCNLNFLLAFTSMITLNIHEPQT